MIGLEGIVLADRYFLKRLAGKGGMAQVYQAWDRQRSDYVAIKVIHNIQFVESFIREAQALAILAHSNIVRLYEVNKDDEKKIIFIVMDWIDGKDLQGALKKRGTPLGLGEVTNILEGVYKALHFAHSLKICHCDIKPANIILRNADNQAILSDFGLAHLVHDQGRGGTLPFMAPELFKGGEFSVSSDIYALGVTLYQLLSGHLPFHGETRDRLIQEHLSKIPPHIQNFNSKIPDRIAHVIEKSLAKDPRQRHQTVTELWIDFSRYASGDQKDFSGHSSGLYRVKGESTHQKIKILGNGITIGRSKKNQLCLRHPSVSRYHAVIIWQQGRFFIRDNGSTVGTYLNGRRLESNKKEKLRYGDKIKIGVADVFEFRYR